MKDLSTTTAPVREYEFAGYRFDVATRQLRNARGEPIELPAAAASTLLFLLTWHGEDVSKEQLMRAVWPNAAVEERDLSEAITALRRVFSDQRREPRFIMTLPGRGYRFITGVTAHRELSPPLRAASRAPMRLSSGAILVLSGCALIVILLIWLALVR